MVCTGKRLIKNKTRKEKMNTTENKTRTRKEILRDPSLNAFTRGQIFIEMKKYHNIPALAME
jgi:hypothetical protein